MIVAIDGPAGSGKSTVAKRLASCLGLTYVDTGAMYRAITFLALEDQIPLHDGRLLGELAAGADLAFVATDDGLSRILVRGRDVSVAIRSPEVTAAVSEVSAHGPVRAALTLRQRELAGFGHSVLEGRDIGTVVCNPKTVIA